jgi:hypothetical protein
MKSAFLLPPLAATGAPCNCVPQPMQIT